MTCGRHTTPSSWAVCTTRAVRPCWCCPSLAPPFPRALLPAETLHENLEAIAGSHRIVRFAAFDQFPYTHHIECGAYLQRR